MTPQDINVSKMLETKHTLMLWYLSLPSLHLTILFKFDVAQSEVVECLQVTRSRLHHDALILIPWFSLDEFFPKIRKLCVLSFRFSHSSQIFRNCCWWKFYSRECWMPFAAQLLQMPSSQPEQSPLFSRRTRRLRTQIFSILFGALVASQSFLHCWEMARVLSRLMPLSCTLFLNASRSDRC